jgi:hypothetical protein
MNIYKILLLFTTGLKLSIQIHGQESSDSLQKVTFFYETVHFLASDSLHGRSSSSIDETEAANFIFSSFKAIPKCKVKRQKFTYQFSDSSQKKQSQNIYCFFNNHADSTIVIGAHYDHIGYGEGLSLAYSLKKHIHNGADDNASGVALMLAIAKEANRELTNKYNYLFVAYSAHEIGLFGSKAFYKKIGSSYTIAKMINFDMVGRLDKKQSTLSMLVVSEQDKSLNYFHQNTALNYQFNIDDKIYHTDCKVFIKNNTPAISFTTGTHNDYHKPSDDADKLNYAGMCTIYSVVIGYINQL